MRFWQAIAVSTALACWAAAGTGGAVAQVAANTGARAMDQQIATYLQQQFAKKSAFSGVRVSVEDRVVTLTGETPSYRDKLNAAHTAEQVESANGLIDKITVGGPTVSDADLTKKLAESLTYDRMSQGQTFNALTVAVKNGHVTVGGNVRDYPDRDSALDIVADTRGVKGMVDHIQVAPLSPMDDQIRQEANRRIYGNPTFARYANNPARPIRIVVANGRVTLAGVVDSQVDKAVAGNQVRSIPGVFGVTNDLEVAH